MSPLFLSKRNKMSTSKSIFNTGLTIIQLILSVLIFFGFYYALFDTVMLPQDYKVLLICLCFLWPFLLKRLDISKVFRINPFSYILFRYIIVFICGTLGLIFLIYLLKLDINRTFLFWFLGIDLVFLYIFIISVYHYAKIQRGKGKYTNNILIIGDKHIGGFINKIENNSLWGYRIKGIVTDSPETIEKFKNRYPIYSIESIKDQLLKEPIDELFYCLPSMDTKLVSDLVYMCLELGVTFRVSSQILQLARNKSTIYYLGETPFFTFQNTPKQSLNLFIKTAFDKVFSLCVLIVLTPLFLLLAILIKIDSKGPVFFKQTRSGLRGREFTLYKFRSMCDHAEDMLDEIKAENEQDGPVFKIKNDKRITRVGRFIRKTSIDELPQFINVLKGDMSVVGPRPPIPAEVKEYKPWQTRRLSMKPGITCIWQVSGRNQIHFEQWMKLDLQYIDTWSIGLDFMIILKTIKTIFKHDGQ